MLYYNDAFRNVSERLFDRSRQVKASRIKWR